MDIFIIIFIWQYSQYDVVILWCLKKMLSGQDISLFTKGSQTFIIFEILCFFLNEYIQWAQLAQMRGPCMVANGIRWHTSIVYGHLWFSYFHDINQYFVWRNVCTVIFEMRPACNQQKKKMKFCSSFFSAVGILLIMVDLVTSLSW